jgi:glycosyltransferase involved in cell wall biosynthesis
MLAGKPVLASNVCDNSRLVADSERGFLFDPSNFEDIASALEKLVHLCEDDWLLLAKNCRDYSEKHLSVQRMVSEYENLFLKLLPLN